MLMPFKNLLNRLRQEVEATDEEILRLIAKRTSLTQEIGRLKSKWHLPVKDLNQEQDVLERNVAYGTGLGLAKEVTEGITQILLKDSVTRQLAQQTHSPPVKRKILIIGGLGKMGTLFSDYFRAQGSNVLILDKEEDLDLPTDVDFVIIATPMTEVGHYLKKLTALQTKATIFDISSLKSPFHAEFQRASQSGLKVISLHPMFGPNLGSLRGKLMILCPGASQVATDDVLELFNASGLEFKEVSFARHDKLMAGVLGLSHVINLIFAETLLKLGLNDTEIDALKESSTFKKQAALAKSVAHESAELYFDIQVQNPSSETMLTHLVQTTSNFRDVIISKKRDQFRDLMNAARNILHRE